jgi:hypothetical protein
VLWTKTTEKSAGMTMASLEVPGDSGAEFFASIAILFACIGVVVVLAVRDMRRLRGYMLAEHLSFGSIVRGFTRLRSRTKMRVLAWAAIPVSLAMAFIVCAGILVNDGFVSLDLRESELVLHYRIAASVHLERRAVSNVRLERARGNGHWRVAVETVAGRTFESRATRNYRDLPEIRSVFRRMASWSKGLGPEDPSD